MHNLRGVTRSSPVTELLLAANALPRMRVQASLSSEPPFLFPLRTSHLAHTWKSDKPCECTRHAAANSMRPPSIPFMFSLLPGTQG